MNLPIIFYHESYKDYLDLSLAQAKKTNPNSDIYLIGDDDVLDKILFKKGVITINKKKYENSYSEFVRYYEHYSTNSYNYELICFIRWFIIREVMNDKRIKSAFICDTDCLIYSNISELYPDYEAIYGSLMIPYNQNPFIWIASGAASYWDINGLDSFLEFLLQVYKEGVKKIFQDKIDFHLGTRAPGGICDMTLLYKFYTHNKEKFSNILSVKNNGTFDGNITHPSNEFENEFDHNGNHKKIKILNYNSYGLRLLDNSEVKFHLLHFQGESKRYLTIFYIGPPIIILKLKLRSKVVKFHDKLISFNHNLLKALNV